MGPEVSLPLAVVIGYLLGSIPFGLVLTRLAGTADLRSIGSGNIGATNVLRTGRKGLAAATLLLDALKGTAAVIIAGSIGGAGAAMLAGLGAFLGHLFPVWLKFRGGKGVAVYIGVLLGLFWPGAIVFCVIWLAVAFLTRYSSLAALVWHMLQRVSFRVGTEYRLRTANRQCAIAHQASSFATDVCAGIRGVIISARSCLRYPPAVAGCWRDACRSAAASAPQTARRARRG